ncbi:MAG: hypothetical protein ACI9S8_000345 [Chlamydiales bacterium]|jgi:hypothetical protein
MSFLPQLPDIATYFIGTLFIPEGDIQDGRDYTDCKTAITYLRNIEQVSDRKNLFRREIPKIQTKIGEYNTLVLLPE